TLRGIIATKEATTKGDILGTNTNATSTNMAADIDRIREYYRRSGYREAQVGVTASPACPDEDHKDCGVGDVAFATGLVEAGLGDDLAVRFEIDPGQRTILADVEIEPADAGAGKELAGGLCEQLLVELAGELKAAGFAKRTDA